MTYLVDAGWLIDATIGRPRAQSTLERLSNEGLVVSIIAGAEIIAGAFGTPDPQVMLVGLRDILAADADRHVFPCFDRPHSCPACLPEAFCRVEEFGLWLRPTKG